MTDKFDNYIKEVEKIQKELEGRITNKKEMDVYIQFRLEGMVEVGAIEMLNSFGIKELEAIARFRRLYSHYFPNELAKQNKSYRKAIESMTSEIKYALYSNKSKDVKEHYLKNAERYGDEALEGES